MKKAFTIIEFLVVMSLIALLSMIVFLGRGEEEERLALQRDAFVLVQNIREVQEMAMGINEVSCGAGTTYSFGVYFDRVAFSESYLLFADCNLDKQKDSSDAILREVALEKGVEVYSLSPSPLTVVFYPPDPITFVNGSQDPSEAVITLALKSNPSQVNNQKKIKINTVGRVEIE